MAITAYTGLQGSGKTTGAGKLARMLRSKGERVMLVGLTPKMWRSLCEALRIQPEVDALGADFLPLASTPTCPPNITSSPICVLPAMPTCEQIMLCFPMRQLWAIITRLSILVPSPIVVGP